MADLATAYLRLIPSLKGARGAIERELGGVDVSGAGNAIGGKLGTSVGGSLGAAGPALGSTLISGVAAGVAAGAAVVGAAAADVAKQAFDAYASYEQLSGGVEKIFDEANIEQIFTDANNAYKDLNMSANQYLESINQVGATFAQTMGDQEGYDTARQGMQAIADYASGTGRSVDELNEKYKLITRSASGYQSIADQFAGILPQTSDDFLAQAQAAGILTDEYTSLTDVPVAEYQQAVTEMLQKGVEDLGLAGNTLAESTETISGSIAMFQSSWENLLVELAKEDGDVDGAVRNVVDSIEAVLENAAPVIESILEALGTAIGEFAARAGDYFLEHREEIFDAAGQFMLTALEAIVSAIPAIVGGLLMLLGALVEHVLTHIPEMAAAAQELLVSFVIAVAQATLPACQAIGDVINDMLDAAGGFVSDLFDAGANLIQGLIDGIASMPGKVVDAIGGVVGDAIDEGKRLLGIASPSKVFREIGRFTMEGYVEGVDDTRADVARAMRTAMNAVVSVGTPQFATSTAAAGGYIGSTGNVYYVSIDGSLLNVKQKVVDALDEIATAIEQEAVM